MSKYENMNDIVNYLITWLCYGDEEAAKRVAYTADEKELEHYDVIIVPNGHLGNDLVVPELKHPEVEFPAKGKAVVRTDIVYAAFFFTSRAEELMVTDRDEHGRFAARFSILSQKSRLQIPRLDEYARFLMKILDLPLPEPGFNHIYLTHDVDSISRYRHLRGAVGGILRGETKQVWQALLDLHRDPLYTFPWIIDTDRQVPRAETIYFIKNTPGKGYDYPQYRLWGRDWRQLKKLLRHNNAYLGIHGSYYGSIPPIKYSRMYRAHYLRCSIYQMQRVADAGYTDDFTMGFADQAGFRLQTTRAVRWINPKTMELTRLTLHPLLVMDNTLSQTNYMNLGEDESYFLCERLLDKVKTHHGDVCLLWHNNSFADDSYHRSLYPKILEMLR